MAQQSIRSVLEELKTILLEEKEALIQSQTDKVIDMIAKKEAVIERMESAELNENEKETVHLLAKEVKDLQETNKMLTEQAMQYNETFLAAFQKEAQKNNTYSKEGYLKKSGSSGILDQSL